MDIVNTLFEMDTICGLAILALWGWTWNILQRTFFFSYAISMQPRTAAKKTLRKLKGGEQLFKDFIENLIELKQFCIWLQGMLILHF